MPPILADTVEFLDDALRTGSVIDLQVVLLDLTTRVMGNVAYDVREYCRAPFQMISTRRL